MSPWDGFVYNFLTMGVIFPWMYVTGRGMFPGGSLTLAICLTLLAQLPISLAYCFLATILPVAGGDYIYQTRAFGKWGFVGVMSGFVIGILQWVAMSGWLLSTLGLAPFFLHLGVKYESPPLCAFGVWLQEPFGIIVVSLVLAFLTTAFLMRGLKAYVRCQNILFILTLAAIAVIVSVFNFHHGFSEDFNQFAYSLAHSLQYPLPKDLLTYVKTNVQQNGFALRPAFSFVHTLALMPVAWTSLQWATYSVEQNTEIRGADRFRNQIFMLLASVIAVAGVLIVLGNAERKGVSADDLNAMSAAYLKIGDPAVAHFFHEKLQPFPSVLAIAVLKNTWLALIISLGFIANAFQVTCNSYIGVTRILVAMSNDRMLPATLGLDKMEPTRRSPARAHWVYFAASIPFIFAFNCIPGWRDDETLLVTFACGYVFVMSSFAATRIPDEKMRSLWMASSLYRVPAWVFKACGFIGGLCGATMVLAYVLVPELGLRQRSAVIGFGCIVMVSALIYFYGNYKSRRTAKNFAEVPLEVKGFYQ
jgi:basic amino acid/polyamine antiporter, APA family